MKVVKALCSCCVAETRHEVLFEKTQSGEMCIDVYSMLECCGCSTICMQRERTWGSQLAESDFRLYPSPISRREPDWLGMLAIGLTEFKEEGEAIGSLLKEAYEAIAGGQYRLAAMGIRAVIEQVMIAKVGDFGTFNDKLDKFQANGFVSFIQRDALRSTLDVGDAAMHRGFEPSERELNVALDIVEGVLAPIYGHGTEAEKLAVRVPPRVRAKKN